MKYKNGETILFNNLIPISVQTINDLINSNNEKWSDLSVYSNQIIAENKNDFNFVLTPDKYTLKGTETIYVVDNPSFIKSLIPSKLGININYCSNADITVIPDGRFDYIKGIIFEAKFISDLENKKIFLFDYSYYSCIEKELEEMSNEDFESFIKKYDPNCTDIKIIYNGEVCIYSSFRDIISKNIITDSDFDILIKSKLNLLTKEDIISNIDNNDFIKILTEYNIYATPFTMLVILLSISPDDLYLYHNYFHLFSKKIGISLNQYENIVYSFKRLLVNLLDLKYIKKTWILEEKIKISDMDYNLARSIAKIYFPKVIKYYTNKINDNFKGKFDFNINIIEKNKCDVNT